VSAGSGHAIAFQFAGLLKRHPDIRYVRDCVSGVDEKNGEVIVTTPAGFRAAFSLVIDCRGAGAELPCKGFQAVPFWSQTDPRKLVAAKAKQLGRPPRVMISGGGDGAIQDLLLLATGIASIGEIAYSGRAR
jgi:hypothetical protein